MARITALSAASFVMFTITSAFRTSSNASFALAKNKKRYTKGFCHASIETLSRPTVTEE